MEYLEMIDTYLSTPTAVYLESLMTNAPCVQNVLPEYKWRLIRDEDDDKFVDAYVASDADYRITEDRHFAPLKNVAWPTVKVIGLKEALQILTQ